MAPKPDEPVTLAAQYEVAAHKLPSESDWRAPAPDSERELLAPPRRRAACRFITELF